MIYFDYEEISLKNLLNKVITLYRYPFLQIGKNVNSSQYCGFDIQVIIRV